MTDLEDIYLYYDINKIKDYRMKIDEEIATLRKIIMRLDERKIYSMSPIEEQIYESIIDMCNQLLRNMSLRIHLIDEIIGELSDFSLFCGNVIDELASRINKLDVYL